jgi:Transglutaminase-like superfamily
MMQERVTTHVELARAVFRWLVRNVTFPKDTSAGQSVSAALFPERHELEEALLYGADGTWAERLALLYVAMAKACHLEAVTVSGFWRSEHIWPGTVQLAHNHCWNAVKVEGRWRLIDCTEGVLARGHTMFFTDPIHFRVSHQPLNAPWSLLRDYISNKDFFAQPWARCSYFNAGCRILTPALAGTQSLPRPPEGSPLPVMSMSLAIPTKYRYADGTCSMLGLGLGLLLCHTCIYATISWPRLRQLCISSATLSAHWIRDDLLTVVRKLLLSL